MISESVTACYAIALAPRSEQLDSYGSMEKMQGVAGKKILISRVKKYLVTGREILFLLFRAAARIN